VGARFGDSEPLSEGFIEGVENSDRALLEASGAMDAEGFFEVVTRECDRTRVCGTSSIYTMLQAMEAEGGELLKYDQAIDEEAQSMVSFASMVFY
jgi:AmmeMemoRadiSam system protein B